MRERTKAIGLRHPVSIIIITTKKYRRYCFWISTRLLNLSRSSRWRITRCQRKTLEMNINSTNPAPVAPRTALISTNHIPRVALGPRRAALAETLPESDTIGCMACNINISIRCSTDTPRFAATCQLQLNSRNPRSPLLLKLLPSPALTQRPNKIAYSSYTPRRSYVTVRSHMATEEKSISGDRMLVFVPPHPLIKHWVSILRNEQTPCPIFRNAMAELGRLLMYEASRDWLPTVSGEIQSPMGVASVEFIDPREPVAVIPILRAGLVLVEHASSILPAIKTYHLGISRDEETLQPSIYLNKLPEKFPEGSRIFVVDPMLATGGTVVAALNLVKECGVENKQIKVISAVAAPPALQKLSENFPGLHVYTGIIDPTVNDKGFIVPGLGDAGDRSFGT